jgi:tyrosine-protein kinase Etk/Wzc
MKSDENNRENAGSNGGGSLQPIIVGDEKTIDLREILVFLWDGKWIVAAVTVVLTGLALLYAFLATPIYEADSLVQIEQKQDFPSGANSGILSVLTPVVSPTKAEIDIMQSRSVLGPTIRKENLNIIINNGNRFQKDPFGDSPVIVTKLVVPDSWIGENLSLTAEGNGRYMMSSPSGGKVLRGRVGESVQGKEGAVEILVKRLDVPAGRSFPVRRIYNDKAIAVLLGNFDAVEKNMDSGIVKLSLQGKNPERIKRVLNTITNQFVSQNAKAMARRAHKSLSFVNKQLPKTKEQLHAAQAELAKYRAEKGVISLDKQAQGLLQELTDQNAQLTQLQMSESAMQQRFTNSYPGIQAIESQKRDIQSKINETKQQISQLPGKEQKYVNLLQRTQVYQQLYTALLSKVQDLRISQASPTGSAYVVDYAVTSHQPVKPVKSRIVLLGFCIGLLLGILWIFVRRLLNRSIDDAADLERDFGLPVYGVIPHSSTQARRGKKRRLFHRKRSRVLPLLALEKEHDPAVEAMRSLASNIGFVMGGAEPGVLAITGCTQGSGKDFMSANLAYIMGKNGTSVLLVDADLHRGHLETYQKSAKHPGLSEVLRGQAGLDEAIISASRHDNVDFLPTGAFPPIPFELISGSRLKAIIRECADNYDLVIVNSPPILSTAEGVLVARVATAHLLIVRAGMQKLQEVRMAVDRMRQSGIKLEGFIFNDLSRVSQSYTYGRYARGYYFDGYAAKGKK